MGYTFFGVDIQQEVADAMPSSEMPPLQLRTYPQTARVPGHLNAGTNKGIPTVTDCWGAISDFSFEEMQVATDIQKGDKKIVVIAKPLDDAGIEPTFNDEVVDVTRGKIYQIVKANTDAARAAWHIHCRG